MRVLMLISNLGTNETGEAGATSVNDSKNPFDIGEPYTYK